MVETGTNILLNIPNHFFNTGVAKILRHTSVAVKRFGGKYKNAGTFYSSKLEITYNQWPKELAKYKVPSMGNIGMTHADLPRGSTTEQLIPLTEHGCIAELIIEQQMKQAMGSSERMAEFVADKIEVAAARGSFAIDQKMIQDITNSENYADTAIFLNEGEEYKPGVDKHGVTNIRKWISTAKSTAAALKWPSDKFNKFGLMAASWDLKRIGVIISEEYYGQMEDHYGQTFNLEYAKLERVFAWIDVLPISQMKDKNGKHIGVHAIFINDDGYVCEIDDGASSGWDGSRQIFQEKWWYRWLYAFQDMALGKNAIMFAVKPPKEEETEE